MQHGIVVKMTVPRVRLPHKRNCCKSRKKYRYLFHKLVLRQK